MLDRQVPQNYFQIVGDVDDHLFGRTRNGGLRLYRVDWLERALRLLEHSDSVRPESGLILPMAKKGHPSAYSDAVLGLHAAHQSRSDVYRTAKVFAHKHAQAVAELLDGVLVSPDTSTPARRRLLNSVEELAIAASIPVPPVYVLPEMGINAFAAGHSTDDAVIGITEGALQQLDRDELQGVLGHEFSHILNGDMRLNIRLMALLHGILFIAYAGRVLLQGSRRPVAVSYTHLTLPTSDLV